MGMLIGGFLSQSPASSDVLNLNGESIIASNALAQAKAELTIDVDGLVYRRLNTGIRFQIDAGTNDWVRPVASASLYQVRYTALTGDALDGASNLTLDVWAPITVDRILVQTDNTPTLGGKSSTFTIEIRKGTGPVLVSGSYTLTADREDF